MAISVDDTQSSYNGANGETITVTVAGGNTLVLAGSVSVPSLKATNITIGGVSMTKVIDKYGAKYSAVTIWYKVGVAVGATGCVFTHDAGEGGCRMWAMALSGVRQDAPIKESQSGTVSGDVTLNFTAADTDGIIITTAAAGGGLTIPTGYTSLWSDGYRSGAKKLSGVASNESIFWDQSGAYDHTAGAVSVSAEPPVLAGQPVVSPFLVFFNRLKWGALWQPKGGLIT